MKGFKLFLVLMLTAVLVLIGCGGKTVAYSVNVTATDFVEGINNAYYPLTAGSR